MGLPEKTTSDISHRSTPMVLGVDMAGGFKNSVASTHLFLISEPIRLLLFQTLMKCAYVIGGGEAAMIVLNTTAHNTRKYLVFLLIILHPRS